MAFEPPDVAYFDHNRREPENLARQPGERLGTCLMITDERRLSPEQDRSRIDRTL